MVLTSNQRNWSVFFGAIAITVIAAAIYFGSVGVNDDTIRVSLRLSAHAAFVLLLVVFVARPLRQLVNSPLTLALLRNRRLIGIAFAGIHTAHLGLIFYRDKMVDDFDLNISESLLGGATYVVIYLMFITSFDATTRALGPKNWRLLHKVGLYWILLAFVPTLLPASTDQVIAVNGFLILLTAVAVTVRLTAFFAKRKPRAQRQ
ncbi:MAG: ferric reductase-like transmembrane domain-containing protein [Gammaproteobacteria bacterium]|nr:ferric reductase-like transmembrane domain-containing protein [Gammaproteobacteria bacterium]MDH3374098.1 ferric reductase-like transmembrane domain-containing protein [Gammaproteobacteria bacterium]MDH3408776.1 ferric reductase-like transmembrane domain-containing protein [Gammaproteobacteria bacterium]